MKKIQTFLIVLIFIPILNFGQSVEEYYKSLKEEGVAPIEFIQKKLQNHDLIIFDDALHNAAEPFEFYCDLIRNNDGHFKYL